MNRTLYLGREQDSATGALGARLDLDASDLLTHALIVGMTGSGKTGLGIALIEEVLRLGVPVLAIDPKGDLGNLLLLFPDFAPASFGAWVDAAAAAQRGLSPDAAGREAADAWRKGLADWQLTGDDLRALAASHEAAIFTPGSTAGRGLAVLQSLAAPEGDFAAAAEDLRDEIAGIVSGLLGLLKIEADPLQSREHVFLSNLIEGAWRAGRGLTLETLIAAVADPPFDKVGALPLETVYPKAERHGLMMALNNLLASPSFEAWRQGEPLDVQSLLFAPGGRPRLSIVYTAHLREEERRFVTALLLDKVKTWMRRQGGTSALRALVYMDEIFGYFPPHPANPPTKRPLLTLLKQARAQGVGVVLATQNPVDLDYKGLANIGTWLIGRLQTDQDRDRLRDGLLGAGGDARAIDRLLGATAKRVFLLHDVHRPGPCLLRSRFAMSYLRGPLTRDEVARLTPASATRTSAAPEGAGAGPPLLPSPFRHHFLARYGGELAEAHLLVKFAVRYKGAEERVEARAYPLAAATAAELLEAEPVEVDEAALATEPPEGVRFAALPGLLAEAGARGLEKVLRDRLPDKLAVVQLSDPVTKAVSQPGEGRAAFAERLVAQGGGAAADKLRAQIEKKRRDLALKEQEEKGRETEKWAALGSAAVSVLGGLLGGRKGSGVSRTMGGLSKASSVLSKNRMEGAAEMRVESLREELAALEARLLEATEVDAERFEERPLVPRKSDVKLLRYDVVWIY